LWLNAGSGWDVSADLVESCIVLAVIVAGSAQSIRSNSAARAAAYYTDIEFLLRRIIDRSS
jgi:hypothetical protein